MKSAEIEIILLVDYNNKFGSKSKAVPLGSGMDKNLLRECFSTYNIKVDYINFFKVIGYSCEYWRDKIVLYTSAEDVGYYYKSYIEDIVLHIQNNGGLVIPNYNFLRANNNKVYMELLRKSLSIENNNSKVYGCFEEIISDIENIDFPLVYKTAAGAMSKGVGLIKEKKELKGIIKKISRTRVIFKELREIGRGLKIKGYLAQSKYRKKFIVQPFIENLDGDFKVLIFGNKFYVLKRSTKKNDFRASGSGIRIFTKDIPKELFFYAKEIFQKLNVPNASLDIAFDGNKFYLIEFQCVYFGPFTLTYSEFYWQYNIELNEFSIIDGASTLEVEYANSVNEFLMNLI